MGELVLIRHGETEWSAGRRHTSVTDLDLTADGVRQAAALATAVADRRFAAVFSSPRLRARWIGLPPAAGGLLRLDTATVSVLGHEHGRRVIRRWNTPAG